MSLVLEVQCEGCGGKGSHQNAADRVIRQCERCNGAKWVPTLDGVAVLAIMQKHFRLLHSGQVLGHADARALMASVFDATTQSARALPTKVGNGDIVMRTDGSIWIADLGERQAFLSGAEIGAETALAMFGMMGMRLAEARKTAVDHVRERVERGARR